MNSSTSFNAQVRGWRMLRGLRPAAIDLARLALIRETTPEDLLRPAHLENLLIRLGLNDEGLEEFPPELHPFSGQGLRVWQYPSQFSKYLAKIATLDIRSYMELGVRHGGSFVATVEVLERFGRLDFAVAVDIIPCPAMDQYATMNPRIEFACLNTQSAAFAAILARLHAIDLVFIDSHHEESQCRQELAELRNCTNMIALHDVFNVGCPGIGKVWEEIKAADEYVCFEFTDQYRSVGPYMGIGLAVKKERLAASNCVGSKEEDR